MYLYKKMNKIKQRPCPAKGTQITYTIEIVNRQQNVETARPRLVSMDLVMYTRNANELETHVTRTIFTERKRIKSTCQTIFINENLNLTNKTLN